MTKKQTAQVDELSKNLAESVIAATAKMTDEQKCKTWEATIFMIQHHVNSIKPTL